MKRLFFSVCILLLCAAVAGSEVVHPLEKGETIYALSRKYNVPVDIICGYNGISNTAVLKVGQEIRIPAVYTVETGDTLYGISRKTGVSVDDLQSINKLGRDAVSKPGQILCLSLSAGTPAVSVVKETGSISIEVPSVTDPRSYERKKLDDGIIWPVNATDIYYLSGKLSGVALSAKKGETVTSVASGSVISTGPYRGFGQVVFIQSLSGYMYVYAGLETIKVRKGDRISFGDAIGTVGNDTLSGKAQLNFIVYNKNTPIDPASAPRG